MVASYSHGLIWGCTLGPLKASEFATPDCKGKMSQPVNNSQCLTYWWDRGPLVDVRLLSLSDLKPWPSPVCWAAVGLAGRRWLVRVDNRSILEGAEDGGVAISERDSILWPGELAAAAGSLCAKCTGPCCNQRHVQTAITTFYQEKTNGRSTVGTLDFDPEC